MPMFYQPSETLGSSGPAETWHDIACANIASIRINISNKLSTAVANAAVAGCNKASTRASCNKPNYVTSCHKTSFIASPQLYLGHICNKPTAVTSYLL